MTGDAGQTLNRDDALGRHSLPLRDRLRCQVADITRDLCRPAYEFDSFCANLFHGDIESISFRPAQVSLSMKILLSSGMFRK